MQHFCIRMSKNDKTFVTYFAKLSAFIIQIVSNNIQSQICFVKRTVFHG